MEKYIGIDMENVQDFASDWPPSMILSEKL